MKYRIITDGKEFQPQKLVARRRFWIFGRNRLVWVDLDNYASDSLQQAEYRIAEDKRIQTPAWNTVYDETDPLVGALIEAQSKQEPK